MYLLGYDIGSSSVKASLVDVESGKCVAQATLAAAKYEGPVYLFQRIVTRMLPDGSTSRVYPFHISLEGMESVLLCRDDEDFDHLEKSTYLAARKNNVIVVISIEMSNHGHTVALAKDYDAALGTGILIKKRHSQYLNWKYGEKSILSRSQVDVRYLDSDTYVRNALAYVPRNALDAGARVEDYRWSGYRGMFVEGRCGCSS